MKENYNKESKNTSLIFFILLSYNSDKYFVPFFCFFFFAPDCCIPSDYSVKQRVNEKKEEDFCLTAYCYHVTNEFQSESTLYNFLECQATPC